MKHTRKGLSVLLTGASLLVATWAEAAPRHPWRHGTPGVFRRDPASTIGQSRQHYDRQLYDRYDGHPGAQFELRQKRQNLCRNVPEMC